jgi:hypothetical protein
MRVKIFNCQIIQDVAECYVVNYFNDDSFEITIAKDAFISLKDNCLIFQGVRMSPLETANKWKRIWKILAERKRCKLK